MRINRADCKQKSARYFSKMGFFRINKEVQARTYNHGQATGKSLKTKARKLFIMEGKRKLGRAISNKSVYYCAS